jgi:hypothetical protein
MEASMDKNRAAVILVLFVVSAVFLGACSQEPSDEAAGDGISLEEAAEAVLQEVVDPDTLTHEVIVFAHPSPLQSGDVLESYCPELIEEEAFRVQIESEKWFFWIEDRPGARFAHPTRFVFVDRVTGEILATEDEWWPVLNGEGLWVDSKDYWDEENWVFSNVEWRPSFLSEAGSSLNGNPFSSQLTVTGLGGSKMAMMQPPANPGAAIVINGWKSGESGKEDFEADADGMHDALEGAGFDTTYLGPDEDTNPDKNGASGLEPIVDWLGEKAAEMKPSQTLLFYITAHGSVSEASGRGFADSIFENTLQLQLQRFDPGVHIIVIVDSCKSGSFIDSLKLVADVTITSTNPTDPGWGDIDRDNDPNPDDKGGEFTSGFVEDWVRILSDPAEIARVAARAERRGENFWEALAGESYVTAVEKDAAYLNGMSFPMIEHGGPATKPSPTPALDVLDGAVFDVDIEIGADPSNHGPFIKLPFTMKLTIRIDSVTFEGPPPWVTVTGELEEDGSFIASGSGTVAGFSGIAVTFEGNLSHQALSGEYVMGTEGGLPGGQSITYIVTGSPVSTEASPTPEPPGAETPQEFYERYTEAMHSQEVGFLYDRLHPVVIERYGAEACQSYLQTILDPGFDIGVEGVGDLGPWIYEMDDRSTQIEDVFPVDVVLTSRGETKSFEVHLALMGGKLYWFTDCGEPLE